MSRPALNARLPAARNTTALTESSALTICHASAISSHMVRLNALSWSGRFSVMVATRSPLSTSSSMVSKLIGTATPVDVSRRTPGAPNGKRRIQVDDVGDLMSALQQPIVFDDLADHPEVVCPLRTHPFVLADQSHPQRG